MRGSPPTGRRSLLNTPRSWLSIGIGLGPQIGIQKGPPLFAFRTISVRPVGAGRGCGDGASAGCRLIVSSALEAPTVVAGLDDIAMVSQTIEQRGRHLGIAEDTRPLPEGEVRGDDDRGPLVEPADEVEQELSAGLGEGQIAEFVEDDDPSLRPGLPVRINRVRPPLPGGRREIGRAHV